ncbi:MAG: hypothetical protein U1F33_04035 [Alphaproteobacteria bacterium]
MTDRRFLVLAIAGAAAVLLLGLAVRFFFIEPAEMGQACLAGEAPWWCPLRDGLVRFFRADGFGFLAVAAGLLAHLMGSRRWAAGAVLLGAAALVLYNTGLGAVAFLLGVLRMVRS